MPAWSRRMLSILLAITAVFAVVTAGSAGRAWCRADPVLIVGSDVVDIQVASSLKMYGAATGPIEMVVSVPRGTRANVLLNDIGFGRGYDVDIVTVESLPNGVRASVAVRAPASDDTLPVTVYGTRATVDVGGLLRLRPNILWADQASGSANQWIVLNVR